MAMLGEQKQVIMVVKPNDIQAPTEEPATTETAKNDEQVYESV